jgi:hypothetical protein
LPAERLVLVTEAVPPASATAGCATPSMVKTTLPAGTPPAEVTEAVNVDAAPKTPALGEAATASVVAAAVTACPPVSVPVLAAKVGAPE